MNPYQVLGLDASASNAEIKAAYRKLAMKYHPDQNPGDKVAEEKFKEISQAYELIKTPAARSEWDNGGHTQFGSGGGSPHDDILRKFRDQFGAQFSGGQWTFTHVRPTKNLDVNLQYQIGLKEVFEGLETDIQYVLPNGYSRTATLKLEPGAFPGFAIRLGGLGDQTDPGLPPGDLIVRISVDQEGWRRQMNHAEKQLEVNVFKLMLGGEIDVVIPNGETKKVKVRAGAEIGSVIRIPKAGFPEYGNKAVVGDAFIRLLPEIPTLTTEEKVKLMEAGF